MKNSGYNYQKLATYNEYDNDEVKYHKPNTELDDTTSKTPSPSDKQAHSTLQLGKMVW